MQPKDIIEAINPHWLAAAAGALVGLKALPGTSVVEKASNIGAGFAIAAWFGPAVVDHLEIIKPSIAAGMVFAIGACGLVIFHSLIAAIKATDFGAWLGSWLPRRKDKE